MAQLYWQAFGRKLGPAFADSSDALTVIRSGLRCDQMLVAREEGSVIGVCGFYEGGSSVMDMSWPRLRRTLSRWASLRAMTASAVLSRSPRTGTIILDGICVHADARSRGVGTALLDSAIDHARSISAYKVGLCVIDSNPRAKSLYERYGFTATGSGRLGILRHIYGSMATPPWSAR